MHANALLQPSGLARVVVKEHRGGRLRQRARAPHARECGPRTDEDVAMIAPMSADNGMVGIKLSSEPKVLSMAEVKSVGAHNFQSCSLTLTRPQCDYTATNPKDNSSYEGF